MPVDWRARAGALGKVFPPGRLHPGVVAWAQSRPSRERWAVAFSGGADSLALLLLLWAHWPGRRSRLRAMHFNHRLRGAASAGDARFCASVCRALGVALDSGAWSGRRRLEGEAEAREARLAFFRKSMAASKSAALWLGHQQDDVAESMLMRLSRGSGAAGLAAPRPVQRGPGGRLHLRPLLDIKKAEIAAALRAGRIPWREDATNRGSDFFRNRIRRTVLPAWVRAAGRDAVAGAALARGLLEEDDLALEAWVDRLRPLSPAGRLNLGRLAGVPRAVLRRALRRWLLLQPGAAGLSRQGFEALMAAAARGLPARHSLGTGGFAVIRRGWLFCERNPRIRR